MAEFARKPRKVTIDAKADRAKADARRAAEEIGNSGMYPLNAPGMPLPGPDFMLHARAMGDLFDTKKITQEGSKKKITVLDSVGARLEDLHRHALRMPGFAMPITVKGNLRREVPFVPGHIWGQYLAEYENGLPIMVDGPRPADVMVIGKMPGWKEVRDGRCLVGESGKLFIEMLRQYHVDGVQNWYVTNLLKFQPPDDSSDIKAGWLADCLPLLHQELRIVRPKYVLCLGADASKALLGPKCSVDAMEGRVVEFTFPLHRKYTEDKSGDVYHTSLVMTTLNPAAVVRSPDQRRRLERGIVRFDMLQRGIRFDQAETDIDHRAIRTLEELEALLWEIDHDPEKKDRWIAFDAEWHGEHPQNKGSYIRTIQIAWRPKHAAAIVWCDVNGQCAFFDVEGKPARKRAMQLLDAFLARKRLVAHFGVADLEWLTYYGFKEIVRAYKAPLRGKSFEDFTQEQRDFLANHGFEPGEMVPAWARTWFEGGHDTGLAGHAIEETAQLGLEVMAMRLTTVPRYDVPLNEWKAAYCKEHKLTPKNMEGYGPCPDRIIIDYGCYDADATLRILYEQLPLLDCDYDGNCCRESFWESMLTIGPILEMHQVGIPVSRERIDFQTKAFMVAREAQEKKIQDWARWPDFNIRSVMKVREFLFSEKYNGKKTKDGSIVRLRPAGAKSLYLDPVLDTSKPPRPWEEVREKGLEGERNAGTGKTILAVLAQDNQAQSEQIKWVRDFRFLDQVLKSVLSPPVVVEDDETAAESAVSDDVSVFSPGGDNLAGVVYDAGLASVICDDERVRTHFYPTAETKRWRSARPPIQNLSKRRDPDYTRMLGGVKDEHGNWVGGNYKYKLRSLFHALPGHVLVEADFKGAELYGMAIMSGDKRMIEHAIRNQLAEDHPDYYDIHSNIAVMAFNLQCAPTKKGLKSIGKVALRIAAKNVIFGVAYGRGAKAIALQCKEEGNPITVEEAQKIVDTIFQFYPGLVPFFAEARARASDPRWLCSCFGAFRRFSMTSDFTLRGEFEREAMNFSIQSMIASAMDRALANMEDYRENVLKDPEFFKFAFQGHDAVMLHVPYANVDRVVDEVLPENMTNRLAIYPTNLAGVPTGEGPYRLGIDIEVYQHWGEAITPEFCRQNGISEKYAEAA